MGANALLYEIPSCQSGWRAGLRKKGVIVKIAMPYPLILHLTIVEPTLGACEPGQYRRYYSNNGPERLGGKSLTPDFPLLGSMALWPCGRGP